MSTQVRLNDQTSHGGTIVTASDNVTVNGRGAARIGDSHACPVHGINEIVGPGNPKVLINGRISSKLGDMCACGAIITTASSNTSN